MPNVDEFCQNDDIYFALAILFLLLLVFLKSKDSLIKVLIHALIWSLLIYLLFRFPILGRKTMPYPEDFIFKQIAHMVFMVVGFYANTYCFVPRLLLARKPLLFLTAIISFVLVSSFSLSLIDSYLEISSRMEQSHGKRNWAIPYIDSFGLLTSLFVLGISTGIGVTKKWNADRLSREAYEHQKVETELGFLKAQIHPHFFFNTLNSIYALTYTDVETSRKVLNKLSRMMRYLLYETTQNLVPLEKELTFIKDYVGIMKLRVNTNTHIAFSYPEVQEQMFIAPMLLLPYVENAFKHGIDDIDTGTIIIEIALLKEGISLRTQNKIIGKIGGLYEESSRMGIGMANTKRRLDILYENQYSLTTSINEANNEYNLELRLSLT